MTLLTMLTVAMAAVPGALVCPDLDTASFVSKLYTDSFLQTLDDRFTNGASRLAHGAPIQVDPSVYGCVLLPPGTRVTVRPVNGIIPVIVGPGGETLGVTLPDMVRMAP